jgi:hypothetical protein
MKLAELRKQWAENPPKSADLPARNYETTPISAQEREELTTALKARRQRSPFWRGEYTPSNPAPGSVTARLFEKEGRTKKPA